jgi:hypothetical protein
MPEESASVEQTAVGSAGSTHDVSLNQPTDTSSSTAVVDDSGGNGQRQESQGPAKEKKPSLYYQVRQAKKAFKAEQEAFAREREIFARERAEFEEARKPKRDYTLDDLRKYRRQWEQEGNFELVEKADKEISAMEAEAQAERAKRTVELPPVGTPEHRAQWEAAERELSQVDPEFMRDGTRLDKRLREIMGSEDGNIYRQHPRGIVAAYHRAKMELLEGDYKVLQTENSKLKNELQRYTGLTSIGGGAPARIGSGNRVESLDDFRKLSLADMRKELKRGAKRDGVPWF